MVYKRTLKVIFLATKLSAKMVNVVLFIASPASLHSTTVVALLSPSTTMNCLSPGTEIFSLNYSIISVRINHKTHLVNKDMITYV